MDRPTDRHELPGELTARAADGRPGAGNVAPAGAASAAVDGRHDASPVAPAGSTAAGRDADGRPGEAPVAPAGSTATERAAAGHGPGTAAPECDTDVVAPDPVAIARQRWRLGLARHAQALAPVGRELMDAWEAALDRTGLPLMRVGRGPARITFGAPLPASVDAEHELAEIVLSERCEIWRVREALEGSMPGGWRLVSLDDVWLGTPSLPGLVAAADYRIELGLAGPDTARSSTAASIAAAADALLRSPRLPRRRAKGGATVEYDLRPLLVDVCVVDAGPPIVIRMRTRLHPSLGSGRPEEVVAAVADELGAPLVPASIVRERIALAEDLA